MFILIKVSYNLSINCIAQSASIPCICSIQHLAYHLLTWEIAGAYESCNWLAKHLWVFEICFKCFAQKFVFLFVAVQNSHLLCQQKQTGVGIKGICCIFY